jgi:hypothetical protein
LLLLSLVEGLHLYSVPCLEEDNVFFDLDATVSLLGERDLVSSQVSAVPRALN